MLNKNNKIILPKIIKILYIHFGKIYILYTCLTCGNHSRLKQAVICIFSVITASDLHLPIIDSHFKHIICYFNILPSDYLNILHKIFVTNNTSLNKLCNLFLEKLVIKITSNQNTDITAH